MMTAQVQERIKRQAKQWFADYGINMKLYDRGFLTHEEGDVTCSVNFKRLDGKRFELLADNLYFDDNGDILQVELEFR